jgi:hypothetical protein
MQRKERYKLTRERNESDMICEKIIDTKPTDKEIIEKIVRWLELNIKAPYLETDLITDNKNLLKAIKDWKKEEYDISTKS